MNDRLVWIDCEMTGLDTEKDALIEVAALVTDFELNVLGEGVDVVIKPPAAALEQMGDVVRTMHTSSGLLAELDDGVDLATAEGMVLDYVRTLGARGAQGAAGGQHGRHRPAVPHPRHADARGAPPLPRSSTCRRSRSSPAAGIRAPTSPRPAKGGNHRALADIQESIEELRYYRAAVFVPPPGPTPRLPAGSRPSTAARSRPAPSPWHKHRPTPVTLL